jgi:hypothetical protein
VVSPGEKANFFDGSLLTEDDSSKNITSSEGFLLLTEDVTLSTVLFEVEKMLSFLCGVNLSKELFVAMITYD